jgi:hypothetical protein
MEMIRQMETVTTGRMEMIQQSDGDGRVSMWMEVVHIRRTDGNVNGSCHGSVGSSAVDPNHQRWIRIINGGSSTVDQNHQLWIIDGDGESSTVDHQP